MWGTRNAHRVLVRNSKEMRRGEVIIMDFKKKGRMFLD
jgi:hypothetical protein